MEYKAFREWVDSKIEGDAYSAMKALVLFTEPAQTGSEMPLWDALGLKDTVPLDGALSVLRVLAMERRELYQWRRRLQVGQKYSAWNEQQAVKLLRKAVTETKTDAAAEFEALATKCLLPADCGTSDTNAETEDSAVPVCEFVDAVDNDETRERVEEGKVVLRKPVGAFKPLIRIPGEQLMNLKTLNEHCALTKCLVEHFRDSVDDETLFLLSLVFEAKVVDDGSHWNGLIREIPPYFSTFPIVWEDAVMEELAGTAVVEDIESKREQMRQFSEQVGALLEAVTEGDKLDCDVHPHAVRAEFTYDNLIWARCAIDSRAFHLNYGSEDGILLTMAHPADMLNHGINTMVLTRKIDDEGCFVLESGSALGSSFVGQELIMSYGPLQSWETLVSYGFVIPGNENDVFPFPVVIDDQGDDEYAEARKEITRREFQEVPDELFIGNDGVPPPVLVALLRMQHAEAEDYESLKANPFAPVSAAVEQQVWGTIANVIETIMDGFPTTEDEDQLLALTVADPNAKLAIQMRLGIKQVGARALEHCAKILADLDEE